MKNSVISKNEELLLEGFRELPEDEQEELLGLVEIKLRKVHKTRGTNIKSSELTIAENNNMVG